MLVIRDLSLSALSGAIFFLFLDIQISNLILTFYGHKGGLATGDLELGPPRHPRLGLAYFMSGSIAFDHKMSRGKGLGSKDRGLRIRS